VSRREIVLPDVQSVRGGDGGDIGAIVHDHGAAGTIRFVHDGPGQIQKRTAVPALDAKLDAPDPGRQERTRHVERRAAGAGARLRVDDRVELRQIQLILAGNLNSQWGPVSAGRVYQDAADDADSADSAVFAGPAGGRPLDRMERPEK
jgi:hypothetical protein